MSTLTGERPELNHREVERRAVDFSHVFQVFTFLHLHPGFTIEQVSENLNLAYEDVLDSLRDLYWGGWVLADANYRFYPVPIFPFAPLVFWIRQLSGS